MKNIIIRDNLTVEKIAEKNSRIDARLFREWQRKMAVIERVNAEVGSEYRDSEPKQSQPSPRSALKF